MTYCEALVQRHEMIAAMGRLGLKGMASAFDEAVTTGVRIPMIARSHSSMMARSVPR